MTNENNNPRTEITLQDIVDRIVTLDKNMEHRFDDVDNRFENIENRLNGSDKRLGTLEIGFVSINDRLTHIEQELTEVKHSQFSFAKQLDVVQDDVGTLSKSFDTHIEYTYKLEKRIKNLELKHA